MAQTDIRGEGPPLLERRSSTLKKYGAVARDVWMSSDLIDGRGNVTTRSDVSGLRLPNLFANKKGQPRKFADDMAIKTNTTRVGGKAQPSKKVVVAWAANDSASNQSKDKGNLRKTGVSGNLSQIPAVDKHLKATESSGGKTTDKSSKQVPPLPLQQKQSNQKPNVGTEVRTKQEAKPVQNEFSVAKVSFPKISSDTAMIASQKVASQRNTINRSKSSEPTSFTSSKAGQKNVEKAQVSKPAQASASKTVLPSSGKDAKSPDRHDSLKTGPSVSQVSKKQQDKPKEAQGSGGEPEERVDAAKELEEEERRKVAKTIKAGKVYIRYGPKCIGDAMVKKRGWVEKPWTFHWKQLEDLKKKGEKLRPFVTDQSTKVEMIKNSSPTFIWSLGNLFTKYLAMTTDDQLFNHYRGVECFTTKLGLYENLKNLMWFDNSNHLTFFPRCYELSNSGDKKAFIDDFQLTACQSIVRHVIKVYGETSNRTGKGNIKPANDGKKEGKNVQKGNQRAVKKEQEASSQKNDEGPTIDASVVDQAVQQCQRWLNLKGHGDLDKGWNDPYQLADYEWDELIKTSYKILNNDVTIKDAASRVRKCNQVANLMRKQNPQFDLDGTKNIWIVKPSGLNRGRGIYLCDNVKKIIFNLANFKQKTIVQKYIERPLLIYNTKFDIRQWFLVTNWNPLTLWFYKKCYLKFCSRQFTLKDLKESVHLSNYAVQKKYTNGPRSQSLPQNNMWDLDTFKEYLKGRGKADKWDNEIYPGMKKAITSTLLVTKDDVENRRRSFELFGADFMLTDDLAPWLIEINFGPDLSPSTSVTKRLCNDVLEDTMKVVIDRKDDKSCETGDFELAFKQDPVITPRHSVSLSVEGKRVNIYRSAPNLGKQSDDKPNETKKNKLDTKDTKAQNSKSNSKPKQSQDKATAAKAKK